MAYKTLLVVLLKLINDPDSAEKSIRENLSEDLKLSVMECLEYASKSLETTIVEQVFQKKNVPLLAQCIFICVELISKEKYRKLR